MNTREAVAQLKEITEKLTTQHTAVYRVDRGCSVGWGLYKNDDIAVQRNELAPGTVFPEHTHKDMAEWIIVYKGRIRFTHGDGETATLGVGDSIKFEPNTPHRAEVLELCHLIGVTIPADEGYPNAAD
jgi:quercetin dioxygenase-like cupin family protein